MFKFDLLEKEKVLDMHRQTEMVLVKPVLWVFFLIYIPWYFLIKYELATDYRRLLLAWTILVFLYAVYRYILWLINVYLFTDKRLVCVHYKSLLNKKISEIPLDKLSNISVNSSGVMPALFRYGDIEVQVMSSPQPFVLHNIREPGKIKDYIWKIHTKYMNPATQTTKIPVAVQAAKKPKMV